VLIFGVLLWLFLLLYLPGRVLFVEVEGNRSVSRQLILEKAEECGVGFGAARRAVRSEKLKNALLSQIPQLQWAGVNTRGCLAVIRVEERSSPATEEEKPFVGNIVAARDGVISSLVTTRGTALCRPGQAVTKGQLLVAGYTDGGFSLRAEIAEAEVFAVTHRTLTAYVPQKNLIRGEIIDTKTEFSIQIGKNVVELFQTDRSCRDGCVKLYKSDVLTLPGGFQLPLALITEKYIRYELTDDSELWQEPDTVLADHYLQEQMVTGQILSASYHTITVNDLCQLRGSYICEEMIGVLRKEEIWK